MSVPNFITLGRIILVPVVFWLLVSGQTGAAFILFVIAGISDGVDGFLAKRFGWTTELGAYLDPLADKLLIVCIFVALGVLGQLPSWLVIAVVSRDLLIVAAVLLSWLIGHPLRISPLKISKANTVCQIALAALVLANSAFALGQEQLVLVMVWATAATTIASLAAYLHAWIRHMARYESPGSFS